MQREELQRLIEEHRSIRKILLKQVLDASARPCLINSTIPQFLVSLFNLNSIKQVGLKSPAF
jgi:hypothetical protein